MIACLIALSSTLSLIPSQGDLSNYSFDNSAKPDVYIVAQKYPSNRYPYSPDPKGDDPHDEIHDPDLPANQAADAAKPPKDVYGGAIPNGKNPY
ncbi:MAG: hypothetical protein SFY67_14215 [Candidatus Melainabacteria bacterium]|nr:hypothetical protein [Candidatus Melainabacteria bacterium]